MEQTLTFVQNALAALMSETPAERRMEENTNRILKILNQYLKLWMRRPNTMTRRKLREVIVVFQDMASPLLKV